MSAIWPRPLPTLVDRGQPAPATDDAGRSGYLGACWSEGCSHIGQVWSVGCLTPQHYACSCARQHWVCPACWWRDWW